MNQIHNSEAHNTFLLHKRGSWLIITACAQM